MKKYGSEKMENKKIEKIISEWRYFCSRINFADSRMDARAIQFMNEFEMMILLLTKP